MLRSCQYAALFRFQYLFIISNPEYFHNIFGALAQYPTLGICFTFNTQLFSQRIPYVAASRFSTSVLIHFLYLFLFYCDVMVQKSSLKHILCEKSANTIAIMPCTLAKIALYLHGNRKLRYSALRRGLSLYRNVGVFK